jgi:hypothetical protein
MGQSAAKGESQSLGKKLDLADTARRKLNINVFPRRGSSSGSRQPGRLFAGKPRLEVFQFLQRGVIQMTAVHKRLHVRQKAASGLQVAGHGPGL